MANDDGPKSVTRRDTFKLAAAVGALGAGLGALLETTDATAEEIKLEPRALGSVAMKIYNYKENNEYTLLKTFDLGDFVKLKLTAGKVKAKPQNYSIKFWYVQEKNEALLKSQDLVVTSTRLKMG